MTSAMMPSRPTFSAPYDSDDKPSSPGGEAWAYFNNYGEETHLCGVIPALPAGFIICLLTLAEGVFFGVNLIWDPFSLGLNPSSAFHIAQMAALGVLSIGDIFMALLAANGLMMSLRPAPFFFLIKSQSRLATLSVGALLPWRALETLLVAPYFGISLAWADDVNRAAYVVGTLIYIAVNAYLLWVLVSLLPIVRRNSEEIQLPYLQYQAEWEEEDETDALISKVPMEKVQPQYRSPVAGNYGQPYTQIQSDAAGPLEEEPRLLWCLPLGFVCFLYILAIAVISVWGFLFTLISRRSFGGWAIILPSGPTVGSAFQLCLELVTYIFTFIFSLLAIAAMGVNRGPLTGIDNPEEALALRKRTHFSLMFFFVANVLRFALFIPITGMNFASDDICGFWTHGVSYLGARRPFYQSSLVPMHCSTLHAFLTIGVLLLMAVDAFFVWATMKLWHVHRAAFLHISEKLQYAEGPLGDYGAAQFKNA